MKSAGAVCIYEEGLHGGGIGAIIMDMIMKFVGAVYV